MPDVRTLVLCAILGFPSMARAAEQGPFQLWQTNAGGDDIHVLEPASGRRVGKVTVGPEPHGLASTADGRTLFATVEASGRSAGELVWIDGVRMKVTRRQPICREPHALAATPDGRWLYVPCRDGSYWVIDGRSGETVRRIWTGGRPHNTAVSRDGAFAFLSPMGGTHDVSIVEVSTQRLVGRIRFGASVRPSALSADGRYLLQHTDSLNGFQVADVARRAVIATVEHATPLPGVRVPFLDSVGRLGPTGWARCHGLGVRPDRDEVWSVCASHVSVHALAEPKFSEVAAIRLPAKGYWITFSPDGRFAYVALTGDCGVAVIDTQTKQILRRLEAGKRPKRNLALRGPA